MPPRRRQFPPSGRPFLDLGVACLVDIRGQYVVHDRPDLVLTRPYVRERDGLAAGIHAEGAIREIDVRRAGDGEGDDQGRRGQEVGLDEAVHAALEVAVPRKDGAGDDIIRDDGVGDLRRQRSRVPHAGRAAEPHDVEAESVEKGLEARRLEVVRHYPGPGRQRGLDPGLRGQPPSRPRSAPTGPRPP